METIARHGESEDFRRVSLDQDELAHDAVRSLRTQRLTKGEDTSIIAPIKHGVMVSAPFNECFIMVLTYFFPSVDPSTG